MKKNIFLLLFLLVGFASQVSGGPIQLQLTANGSGSSATLQNPVEQQTQGGATQQDQSLWVVNNTGLPWDVDDYWSRTDQGYIDPGVSVSRTEYFYVADWQFHQSGIEATTTTKGALFSVQLTLDDEIGTRITVTNDQPVYLSSALPKDRVTYARVAIVGPTYTQTSSKLLPIPNSGIGGVGRFIKATWTVKNLDSKRITFSVTRVINSIIYESWSPRFCPQGPPYALSGQWVTGDPSFGWCQATAVTY